jgi:hypothetical protein
MYIVQESGNNFEVLKQTKVSVNQKVTCRQKTLKYMYNLCYSWPPESI